VEIVGFQVEREQVGEQVGQPVGNFFAVFLLIPMSMTVSSNSGVMLVLCAGARAAANDQCRWRS
jgi:hypothetical protein